MCSFSSTLRVGALTHNHNSKVLHDIKHISRQNSACVLAPVFISPIFHCQRAIFQKLTLLVLSKTVSQKAAEIVNINKASIGEVLMCGTKEKVLFSINSKSTFSISYSQHTSTIFGVKPILAHLRNAVFASTWVLSLHTLLRVSRNGLPIIREAFFLISKNSSVFKIYFLFYWLFLRTSFDFLSV